MTLFEFQFASFFIQLACLPAFHFHSRNPHHIHIFSYLINRQRYPSLAQSLDQLRSSLLEKSDEIAPLKAWEFQDLSLQAAARVAAIQGDEALQILQFTAQNFPSQAKSLLHVRVSDDFKKEMKHNADILSKDLTFQAPDSSIYINGLYFDAETIDMVTLLETLRSEIRVLNGLHKLSKFKTRSDYLFTNEKISIFEPILIPF